ncbi:MmcQ/YjbR family DNA-binding protein [Aestuariibius sp. HNIBRBA575]|uniref:MmcQ/YjbR family DNA-binding protein n=1 Tax=Aestuariibius sp. HNIBRBA575 TaxID=3233343 RepID=UPI0034A25CA5
MTRDEFNTYCATYPHATHVVQWGNSDVWKIGGKVFALCGWANDQPAFTFKASDMAFNVLGDGPGIRPAPYLASRGMKWLQVYDQPGHGYGLSDEALRDHLRASHDMVVAKLTKKLRTELGLT